MQTLEDLKCLFLVAWIDADAIVPDVEDDRRGVARKSIERGSRFAGFPVADLYSSDRFVVVFQRIADEINKDFSYLYPIARH